MGDGFTQVVYGKERTLFKEMTLDGRVEAQRIALRCSDLPAGHSSWMLHLLGDHMVRLAYVESISCESGRQLLRKNDLKPW